MPGLGTVVAAPRAAEPSERANCSPNPVKSSWSRLVSLALRTCSTAIATRWTHLFGDDADPSRTTGDDRHADAAHGDAAHGDAAHGDAAHGEPPWRWPPMAMPPMAMQMTLRDRRREAAGSPRTTCTNRYGRTESLRVVTPERPRRGGVCALGPTGAGKTTLLHLLADLLARRVAAALWLGRDSASLTVQDGSRSGTWPTSSGLPGGMRLENSGVSRPAVPRWTRASRVAA